MPTPFEQYFALIWGSDLPYTDKVELDLTAYNMTR